MNRDYQPLGTQDQYEAEGIDDDVEDTRDLAQVMEDRRAADAELDQMYGAATIGSRRKFPDALNEPGEMIDSPPSLIRTKLTVKPHRLSQSFHPNGNVNVGDNSQATWGSLSASHEPTRFDLKNTFSHIV